MAIDHGACMCDVPPRRRSLGCEGEDVGVRDNARTGILQRRLDGVDHLETPRGAVVRRRRFLRRHPRDAVQQQRRIAALVVITSTYI
jgi:hypothetical protein